MLLGHSHREQKQSLASPRHSSHGARLPLLQKRVHACSLLSCHGGWIRSRMCGCPAQGLASGVFVQNSHPPPLRLPLLFAHIPRPRERQGQKQNWWVSHSEASPREPHQVSLLHEVQVSTASWGWGRLQQRGSGVPPCSLDLHPLRSPGLPHKVKGSQEKMPTDTLQPDRHFCFLFAILGRRGTSQGRPKQP